MIGSITKAHYPQILRMNDHFVHWLSPMDDTELERVLNLATYAKQIDEGRGILIGYPHDVDYPDHKNLIWLRERCETFFYIDRVIIDAASQGRGYGRQLYSNVEKFARKQGYTFLTCEVNTKPDNPGSHVFHKQLGFAAMGEETYPAFGKALRYYRKAI